MVRVWFLSLAVLMAQEVRSQQVLAFPGADGFGRFATGGRDGKVFVVTNLNDSGPGSFREAVKKKEKRMILFAVSGTIALESDLNITFGDLTIAGQSAPGDGICIRNFPVKVDADNVIIRYMRFRLGDEKKQQGDAITGIGHSNIIIDHCSISWATDECASFYKNKNFTMQWCIISESLNHSVHEKGDHGYGGIWGGEGASFHHNLIADHNSRLPRFSGSSTTLNSPDELVEFENNVIYNWMGNSTYGGEKGRYLVIANYYKPGPATAPSKAKRFINPLQPYGKFFIAGNFLYGSPDVTANNRLGVYCDHIDSVLTLEGFSGGAIEYVPAEECFEGVLARAGANLHRDEVDTRIVNDVKNGTALRGKMGIIDSQADVGGWPNLTSSTAPADSDKDGIPDGWERSRQLNPADASDATAHTLDKGYTNLEVFLNEIVSHKK